MLRMVVVGGVWVASDVVQIIIIFFTILFLPKQYQLIGGTHISKEEYVQMGIASDSINKDIVISIQTKVGDIYDCVDIHKQPAFNHPSLKNHKIQMKPTTYPKGKKKNRAENNIANFELDGGGCPIGTVPIRRFEMQNLQKNGLVSDFGRKIVTKDIYTAVAVTRAPTSEYYGTRVRMNIWNPKVGNITDITSSQVWIGGGGGYEANILEAGWMVNPMLYMDWKTRFFVHWTVDAYRSTGCYNTLCPGFIQVNERIPIDAPLEPLSVYKGVQYDVQIDVFKDPETGNWYLLRDFVPIGYWPNSLFNILNTSAQKIDWGGQVNTCKTCTFPEMGSGHYPKAGYGKAAYMKDLEVAEDSSLVLKNATHCSLLIDRQECYYIKQNPIGRGILTGNHIVFGGPGGTC